MAYKKLSDDRLLKLLNEHRVACDVAPIKRWKKSREALEIEMERVEGVAAHGDSPW